MSQPIHVRETEATGYRTVDKAYTYEELLAIFDGDNNCVRPLVLRCQDLEARCDRLAKALWDAACELEACPMMHPADAENRDRLALMMRQVLAGEEPR